MKLQNKFLAILFALALSTQAVAATPQWVGAPKKFYADVTLGAHTPTTSGLGTGFAYGFNLGYKLQDNVSLGVYLNRSSRDPIPGITISLLNVGGDVTYYFNNNILMGLQIGPTFETGTFGNLSASDTEFSFGPKLGFSYPLTESLSLGFEPGAYIVFGETTYAILHFPVVVKVWF